MAGSGKPKALRSIPAKAVLQSAIASAKTVLDSAASGPNVLRPARSNPNRSASPPPLLSLPVPRFQSFDLLATLVAVVRTDGLVLFANAALEDALGISRRTIEGSQLPDCFTEPHILQNALEGAGSNEFAALRYDAWLKRINHEPMPVHVVVAQTDTPGEAIVELLPLEQQAKQDREERLIDQAQANKELIRNLAHEIKNPLGGIRGAAQLLQMEIGKELTEYTQVIIHEADRLQTLVDRLLAPHRRPHLVGDVNIHEVCERVRSLILAEFPKGLKVVRDYDTSIPDFRGDREQLIQAVLNIAHNACQALADRLAAADAQITFRTRIARQVTFGKQRYRLALELHVVDNGPGVPDSIKDRIFYPLVSGREGGSGLGLTLAQTFVQQHHGLIECESVPGRTDFKLLIPLP
jgi:two-component system, NtrC family, nitrogen regulation sensor histidine kinase GlnL